MTAERAPDRAAVATGFGLVADVYERARPSYPAAAVDHLLTSAARRVLDLGAGTGKLSRLLRERGLDVVAVEPSDGMRAQLASVLPDVPVLDGTAERIPLPDHDVDAVVVGQAWHWVDPARAGPEVARVLRPGGTLGLVWNVRDQRVDWVRAYVALITAPDHVPVNSESPVVGPLFGGVERRDSEWTYPVSVERLVELAASRSYVIALPPGERAALLGRVRALLATHPDVAGRASFDLPYVTRAYRARLI